MDRQLLITPLPVWELSFFEDSWQRTSLCALYRQRPSGCFRRVAPDLGMEPTSDFVPSTARRLSSFSELFHIPSHSRRPCSPLLASRSCGGALLRCLFLTSWPTFALPSRHVFWFRQLVIFANHTFECAKKRKLYRSLEWSHC